MPRYIDADAIHYVEIGKGVEIALASDIDKIPTISPDEVRGVGKWIRREKVRPNLPDDSDYEFECSCCGWRDLHNAKMIVPYCWHCGAKMEETE